MSETFDGLLKWRCIGPFRGGRVIAVAGDTRDLSTFYFGACAGGVWKTTDAGIYWECVSDGFFNTAAVGALAVSESDPNVIYAGMGETTIRIDVSHGDGVYKSTDAGRTWRHMGLEDTRFIGKVRIHPHDPDTVYVAALGHAFGPNEERGVYKSTDGGETWKQVLYRSDKAGAVDLSIDIQNPRILYATIWEAYRNFWQISSGGEDSSLYKSSDGGETWTELTHAPRFAQRCARQDGRRGLACQERAGVGDYRAPRQGRALPLGRLRRNVGVRQRRPAAHLEGLVLHAPHRGPARRGHGVCQ